MLRYLTKALATAEEREDLKKRNSERHLVGVGQGGEAGAREGAEMAKRLLRLLQPRLGRCRDDPANEEEDAGSRSEGWRSRSLAAAPPSPAPAPDPGED